MRAARSFRAFALAAALWPLTGCYGATFAAPRSPERETHEVWLDEYFFGLAGSGDVDTRFLCPAAPESVGVRQNGLTLALTALTLGIYTPRIARVTCANPPRSRRGRDPA